jgi:hypothetical protein
MEVVMSSLSSPLAVGFVVLSLALAVAPRWLVAGWNLVGFGLLVTIVTLSILSSPVPFRVFFDEPAVVWITTFPWVWLPTVMVTAALLGHLLVWRSLALGRPR